MNDIDPGGPGQLHCSVGPPTCRCNPLWRKKQRDACLSALGFF